MITHKFLMILLTAVCVNLSQPYSSRANNQPAETAPVRSGQPVLQRVVIRINSKALDTEVAVTPRERYNGLSFRKTLGADAAMLFVYSDEHKLMFTMRDTSIPLSIAYITDDMVINEILTMQPFQAGPYPSAHPAKYALEVNQGWFKANGVKVGDRLHLGKP